MQFRTTGLLLLGAMALPTAAAAQTTAAPPAITRSVVAATKLPTVTNAPLHFKAVSVTLQPDQKSGVSAANGILYQLSGSTEVVLDGEAKVLNAGEGLFIAGGKTAALTAGSGGPSQSDTRHVSGADAFQPTAPSLRRGSILYRLRHRGQHDRR